MALKVNGLLLNSKDSVITVMEDIPAGAAVCCESGNGQIQLTANEEIRKYHKIALTDVAKGSPVFRYGENIGHALTDIHKGDWVHTHNLSDIPEV